MGINLHNFKIDSVFLVWHQKNQQQKKKADPLDFISVKVLCIQGHYQEREKTTYRMGEKHSQIAYLNASCIDHTKNFCNSTIKRKTTQFKNKQRTARHLSKEDIQMVNKHMGRCSASLVIRKMRCHHTHDGCNKNQNQNGNGVGARGSGSQLSTRSPADSPTALVSPFFKHAGGTM